MPLRTLKALRRLADLPPAEIEALRAVAAWIAREHVEPVRAPGISPDAWISPLASLRFADRVQIGAKCAIGPFASVWGGYEESWARIGDQAQIGPGALIVAGNHLVDGPGPVRELGFEDRDVTIGAGAWVGANAVVIGANVGEGAVIGAGAVVTSDIPERAVAVGVPAKVVRMRGDG